MDMHEPQIRDQEVGAHEQQLEEIIVRLSEEFRRFVYSASHDLQEPVRTIANMVALLEMRLTNVDDECKKFMRLTVSATSRLQNMIKDLVEYSRLNNAPPELTEVDTNSILAGALLLLKNEVEASKANISFGDLPPLKINSTHLGLLFKQLLSNSLKFRGQEAPEISIQCDPSHDNWVFCVSDNGIGIESRHHENVFDLFKKLHAHDAYPGTGTGLTICKKIVERVGGKIWVESQPGQGSKFYFSLPR